MPNFTIPFLYRNDTIKNHKVIQFLTQPMLITGGEGGEIILWNQSLQPQTVMYPNLSDTPGYVQHMAMLKCPFLQILDKVDSILLTIHQDMRVRLWDPRDGRCLQVSAHDIFKGANIRFMEILRPTACRFIVLSAADTNRLMLFDLWTMKVTQSYCLDGNNLLALDGVGRIHNIDITQYIDDSICNYLQDHKSLHLKNLEFKTSIDPIIFTNVPTRPLIRAMHEQELRISVLVFTNQISIICEGQNQLIIQQSRNTYKFSNAYFCNTGEDRLLLISTRDGSIIAIRWSDIQILISQLKSNNDSIYSYKEFQFHKYPNSSTAVVQLNLKTCFEGSSYVYQNKVLRQFSQNCIINHSKMNSRLYFYNRILSHFDSYTTDQIIKNLDVQVFSKTEGIPLNGIVELLNPQADFVNDNKKPTPKRPPTTHSIDLKSLSPDDLHGSLMSLLSIDFMKKYFKSIEDVIKNSKVTSRSLFSGNPYGPLYLFGCESGVLFAFPLTFSPQQLTFTIYTARVDNGNGCGVVFLQIRGNLIYAGSEKGRVVTFNLNEYMNGFKMIQDNVTPQKITPSRIKKQNSIELKTRQQEDKILKPTQEDKLLNLQALQRVSDICLPSRLIGCLQIRQVRDQTDDSEEQASAEDQDMAREYVAFQLKDNGIAIFSVESGNIICQLNGIREDCMIYGIYLEVKNQYWLVATSEGSIYNYDLDGKFHRLLSVSAHHPIFRVEERFKYLQNTQTEYHRFNSFANHSKDISQANILVEYALRHSFIIMDSATPQPYETAGPLAYIEFNPNEAHRLMWLLDFTQSQGQTSYDSQKLTKVIEQTQLGDMEWWDLRKSIPQVQGQESCSLRERLASTIFPWGADAVLDAQVDSLISNVRPTFHVNLGIQSAGYAFSFTFQPRWAVSEYFTSLQAMIIMHYYIGLSYRDNSLMTQFMFQTVELFTKKRQNVDPAFQGLDLLQLARYTIDEQNEIMTAACNLIISQVIIKDCDMSKPLSTVQRLLEIQFAEPNPNGNFSLTEVLCLIVKSYSDIFSECGEVYKQAAERVVQGVDLKTAVINPQFAAAILKQLIDGLQHFKSFVNPPQLLNKLFFIFFNYNTALEYMGTLRDNPQLGKKGFTVIEELSKQSEDTKQRMKQLAVKAIIHVGNLSLQDFYGLIRKDILNMELHMLYPCSIIDLIRNYIKSSQMHAIKHLPFLIEIILKSLDPNNPNLRKVCHKAATKALQTVCKMFQCVSFHQATQKIALGSTENQIIIYDLRTAVKWRVLDGHGGQVTALGFDNEGKNLASFSYVDTTLRIWKVGSTGFFGSILGIQGKHSKIFDIPRKQMDINTKVTVQFSDNDSSVFLKIGEQTTYQYRVN